jgi:hypothetical protein
MELEVDMVVSRRIWRLRRREERRGEERGGEERVGVMKMGEMGDEDGDEGSRIVRSNSLMICSSGLGHNRLSRAGTVVELPRLTR